MNVIRRVRRCHQATLTLLLQGGRISTVQIQCGVQGCAATFAPGKQQLLWVLGNRWHVPAVVCPVGWRMQIRAPLLRPLVAWCAG